MTTELVAVDLSQLELRIAAFMSRDPLMMQILRNGDDMHTVTAAGMYSRHPHRCDPRKAHTCPAQGITDPMRKSGKVTNFLVQFGGGWSKYIEGVEKLILEDGLDIEVPTQQEAKHAIATHERLYKRYWEWVGWTKQRARELGYAETAFGRPRFLDDLTSPVKGYREAAERQAVSEAIQGTAADLVKQAMVNISNDTEMSTRGSMVLQVHDEIVSIVDQSWSKWYASRLSKHMCLGQPFEPYVELVADEGIGVNWRDIHK